MGNIFSSKPPPPPVHEKPAVPPQWEELLQETKSSSSPYKLFPVEATSLEYGALKEFMASVNIISADKIVNPSLWQRFSDRYREMLKEKTEDFSLLLKLGLEEEELAFRANHIIDFMRDHRLETESARYSPNQVLLFHCTKSKDCLDQIFLQGLDDRLSYGGLFGRGIYFADDPLKSMYYDRTDGYILIFSVLLGDCLAVQSRSGRVLAREPEKSYEQKRNANDKFFDSITGKVHAGAFNEYVINNRYQCYPLYVIKYKREVYYNLYGPTSTLGPKCYTAARQAYATIAWILFSGAKTAMPNPFLDGNWPFFAVLLYAKMGVVSDHDLQTAMLSPSEETKDRDIFKGSVMLSRVLPNWNVNLSVTISALSHFQTFPVNAASPEFATIKDLIPDSVHVISIEQIVNPILWRNFVRRWEEMMRSKTGGLREGKSTTPSKPGKKSEASAFMESSKYSANLSFLFYTLKHENEREEILTHGLDQRTDGPPSLSRLSVPFPGTFGRALNFIDDPIWSIRNNGNGTGGYVLIFAVPLGDCLPVDDLKEKSMLLREPEKVEGQKRNPHDYCFDSVTARKNFQYNEYGIYNNEQCYPLYSVKYWWSTDASRFGDNVSPPSIYATARRDAPSLAWRKVRGAKWKGSLFLPPPNENGRWPFLAANILRKMNVVGFQDGRSNDLSNIHAVAGQKRGNERGDPSHEGREVDESQANKKAKVLLLE